MFQIKMIISLVDSLLVKMFILITSIYSSVFCFNHVDYFDIKTFNVCVEVHSSTQARG